MIKARIQLELFTKHVMRTFPGVVNVISSKNTRVYEDAEIEELD